MTGEVTGSEVAAGRYLHAPDDAPRVELETPGGMLRGSVEGDLLRFRGIRYATAERFAAPVAEPAWTGVRDALVDGPMCPQPRFGMVMLALPKRIPPMGEDCLHLNVTAPADAAGAAKPVMVWIHGGAYVNGSGGGEIYDPSRLVRNGDVIVVGINYRLGVFGYLPLPGVAEANLGVRDQLAALEWVRDNIASFGGDPERVTLFGQSAGADSIVQLMAMPEADHLYSRVVLQSAPLGLDKGREAIAEQLGRNVLAALEPGVTPRTATEDQLIAAQLEATGGLTGDRLSVGMPYAPTPGVWPVASTAERNVRLARRAAAVDVLLGYARDDFTPFFDSVPALRRAQASAVLRPATVPVAAELTRRVFGAPALALAKLLADNGARVFTYRFDWRPKGTPWGACHCIDLPFVWADEDFWRGSPMLGGTPWADIDAYGTVLQQQWARFARDGVPDAAWPEFRTRRPIGRRLTLDRREHR